MKAPLPSEIKAAHAAIAAEGPAAPITLGLNLLALQDPYIRSWLANVMAQLPPVAAGVPGQVLPPTLVLRGALQGAIMWGINMGLRIGEARGHEALPCGHPAQCAAEGDCVVCSMLTIQTRADEAYQGKLRKILIWLEDSPADADRDDVIDFVREALGPK